MYVKGDIFLGPIIELWRDFWRDPRQVRFTAPLIIINFLGSVYGYYWYHGQLAATPPYFWPFVPDSPLSTTLFALALTVRPPGAWGILFQVVAFTASIKYGIWAVVVISQYWIGGGPVEFTEAMLLFSHLGMAAEGAIYLRTIPFDRTVVLLTGAWMLLNDFMDYGLGLHPYLFAAGQEHLAFVTALGLTASITAVLGFAHVGCSAKKILK